MGSHERTKDQKELGVTTETLQSQSLPPNFLRDLEKSPNDPFLVLNENTGNLHAGNLIYEDTPDLRDVHL